MFCSEPGTHALKQHIRFFAGCELMVPYQEYDLRFRMKLL